MQKGYLDLNRNFPNLINHDGIAHYFGPIINAEQIDSYFQELFHKIEWTHETVVMFGKEITTKRKVAFYSETGISYTYSNRTKIGLPFTPLLSEIKSMVSHITKAPYNACLLNLYHDGSESMGWHTDNEKEIITHSSIASLSLGAERKFSFKHKATQETLSILLESGSLLEMAGELQDHWLHALPKTKKTLLPRINLTFRFMSS